MKILLSAYACEPDKGSEPGVGWNWAIELARLGHEVYVVTRTNNKPSIAASMEQRSVKNLHFIYYDLPDWFKWWKKGKRGVHLYYFLWQLGIYSRVKNLASRVSIDVIHHVTFVSVRQPSFLGLLGIPFIFGPVAGGECAPYRLRKSFPLRGLLTDAFRDLVNSLVKFDPLMRLAFNNANAIYVTSEQTKGLVPKQFHKKTIIRLAIGADEDKVNCIVPIKHNSPIRVLYAGQLIYWKGVHLALRAFAKLLMEQPEAKLTILGKGPEAQWLRKQAEQLNLIHAIEWLDWLPRSEIDSVYQSHHVFLFPSLHDSGGMVVLEAMKNALPVVCLDLGGPGVMVDDSCGYRISTNNRTEDDVVNDLAVALIELSEEEISFAHGAVMRAHSLRWCSTVNTAFYQKITS